MICSERAAMREHSCTAAQAERGWRSQCRNVLKDPYVRPSYARGLGRADTLPDLLHCQRDKRKRESAGLSMIEGLEVHEQN